MPGTRGEVGRCVEEKDSMEASFSPGPEPMALRVPRRAGAGSTITQASAVGGKENLNSSSPVRIDGIFGRHGGHMPAAPRGIGSPETIDVAMPQGCQTGFSQSGRKAFQRRAA